MKINIWWIRRDMRLRDNRALNAALSQGDLVIPLFILDPYLLNSPMVGSKRLAFMLEGLRRLDETLRSRESYLLIRRGNPTEVLSQLLVETGADSIFAERDYSPYARSRDASVSAQLPLRLQLGLVIHDPDLVLKSDGSPYTVYSPYRRRWMELPPPAPDQLIPEPTIIPTGPRIQGIPIPDLPCLIESVPFKAGEEEALSLLDGFLKRTTEQSVYLYSEQRDRMDIDGTSRLSPYLRFGMLSVQRAAIGALQAQSLALEANGRNGVKAWLDELIWRDFYYSILYHFPHVLLRSFRPAYDKMPWKNDENDYQAWCSGRTGYPVVDAAMRQLSQSGWMHNRARMISASFLVKDLLIDWRWGERHFMQHLIDGDPASNNGGWQWTAGTGTDAAPYFRIFNPVRQGQKFDPKGRYIRRWLPELGKVPLKYIHEPWRMPESIQREVDCIIGRDYPGPIVDHADARHRTLDAYAAARDTEN